MSLHRFNASRPLTLHATTSHGSSFGVGAAVLCPVMNTAGGLAVDYDRAASAKAQLQAMMAAIARHDARSEADHEQTTPTDNLATGKSGRPLAN